MCTDLFIPFDKASGVYLRCGDLFKRAVVIAVREAFEAAFFVEQAHYQQIDYQHASCSERDTGSGAEAGSFVTELYFVIAGVSLYRHEAVRDLFNVGGLAVDGSSPALAVWDAEEYELRLFELYISSEAVGIAGEAL